MNPQLCLLPLLLLRLRLRLRLRIRLRLGISVWCFVWRKNYSGPAGFLHADTCKTRGKRTCVQPMKSPKENTCPGKNTCFSSGIS